MATHANSTRAPKIGQRSPLAGIDRRKVAEAVERLIAVLDALDGDADLEATAPDRFGRGFVVCLADDHEDGHDAEDDHAERFGLADTDALLEQFGIALGSGARGIAA